MVSHCIANVQSYMLSNTPNLDRKPAGENLKSVGYDVISFVCLKMRTKDFGTDKKKKRDKSGFTAETYYDNLIETRNVTDLYVFK